MANAAYCTIEPTVDPNARIEFISDRSSNPRANWSRGSMSRFPLPFSSNPSTSDLARPASSRARAIASAAKSAVVRP